MCVDAIENEEKETQERQAKLNEAYQLLSEHGRDGELKGVPGYLVSAQEVFNEAGKYKGLLLYIPFGTVRLEDAIDLDNVE